MPTIRAGEKPVSMTLAPNAVLTITPDAASAGVVWFYPNLVGSESNGRADIGSNQPKVVGPFDVTTRLAIECTAGTLTTTETIGSRTPAIKTLNLSPVLRYDALYRYFGACSGAGGTKQFNDTPSGTGLTTAGVKMEVEGPYNAVALLHVNRASNAINNITALVGSTETNLHSTNAQYSVPIIGGTAYGQMAPNGTINGFQAVKYNGGASSFNFAASTTKQMFQMSDFSLLSDVPRADGGTRPLLLWRTKIDGTNDGNWCYINFTASLSLADPTTSMRGRTIQVSAQAADCVATPVAMPSTNLSMEVYPVVRHNVPVFSVWAVGDSVTQQNAIVTGQLASAVHRACYDLSTPALPVVPSNFGAAGSTAADYLNTVESALAAGAPPPSMIVTNNASINDLPGAGGIQKGRASLFRVLDIARRYRIPYVGVWQTQPNSTFTAGNDADRKLLIAEAQAFAAANNITIRWIDYSSIGDGAIPERWKAAYTIDGLHPNEPCVEDVMHVKTEAVIQQILTEITTVI